LATKPSAPSSSALKASDLAWAEEITTTGTGSLAMSSRSAV
jgi:hypothetical protein